MNRDIARRKFVSALARAWDRSLDVAPDDLDGEARYAIWKMGRTLDRMAPGTTDEIVARRAES